MCKQSVTVSFCADRNRKCGDALLPACHSHRFSGSWTLGGALMHCSPAWLYLMVSQQSHPKVLYIGVLSCIIYPILSPPVLCPSPHHPQKKLHHGYVFIRNSGPALWGSRPFPGGGGRPPLTTRRCRPQILEETVTPPPL